MSSNSIRIGAQVFEMARAQGELMSRSAAQQLEHWAKLGAALEATGLSVADVAAMLSGSKTVPEAELWAFKREQQARDLEAIDAGRATNAQMSWFSRKQAQESKLVDSPY